MSREGTNRSESSAPQGGVRWLSWAGPDQGFDQKVLAFSELDPQPFHDISVAVSDQLSDQGGDEDGDNETSLNHLKTAPAQTIGSEGKATGQHRHKSMAASAQRMLDQLHTPSDSDGTNGATPFGTMRTKNALQKGKRPTRHSELPPRIRDMTSQTAQPKRRKTDISARELNRLGDESVVSPKRRRSENQTTIASGSSSPPKPSSSQAKQQQRTVNPVNPPAQGLSVESMTLPEYKRARTTLLVRLAPARRYRLLKLTQCPNASAFYAMVLGLWDIAESKVDEIEVSFSWMDEEDRSKVMVVDKQQEAYFDYLLEQVDDCPCWDEEKGKCLLDVDILLK